MSTAAKSFEVPSDAPVVGFPVRVFSTNSPNSPEPDFAKAIYPSNRILDSWMNFARKFSEASDSFLIAIAIFIIAALVARRVWIDFAGKKYANIYTQLAASPGLRKSTTIRLAKDLLERLLPPERFTSANTSEEALFCEYDPNDNGSPDKVLIVDEGNTLLANWTNSSYGQIVAKRYLQLYDCGSWSMSFRRNKGTSENKSVKRSI